MPRWSLAVIATIACGHAAPVAPPPPQVTESAGLHREQIAAQVKPFLDAELVSGLVIGLHDAGKTEVYGFGAGPGGAPPSGTTLFELGPLTSIYTALLLAEAVQRRELALDTPLAELLPLGVTAPIRDKVPITLLHLALHSAGLPRMPPSLERTTDPNPFAKYGEDALYSDLIQTTLRSTPGTQISYSSFGSGVLGFVLGRKLGGGYAKLVADRVLRPLALTDTFVVVPAAAGPRRATGTNEDLKPVPAWTADALAGATAMVSTANDQLRLIEAELDAAAGGSLPLRRAMKLTQEPALDRTGGNEGLGWVIDGGGRYWHTGGTGGFHAVLSFDPKTRRGVVLLASTASNPVERLAEAAYKILEGAPPPPAVFATAAQLAPFAGNYDLSGAALKVVAEGKRLYLEATGEPRRRMLPVSDHAFWIASLQTTAVFERDGDKVVRVVFGVGDRQLPAARVDAR